MTTKPPVRRISLRLTDDEMLELAALRQAQEQSERKTVTLQAALRVAIDKGFDVERKALNFSRIGSERDKRLELVIDETVGAKLDAMQADRPDETHSSIVLACGRITKDMLNAQLASAHSRRKGDRPRP